MDFNRAVVSLFCYKLKCLFSIFLVLIFIWKSEFAYFVLTRIYEPWKMVQSSINGVLLLLLLWTIKSGCNPKSMDIIKWGVYFKCALFYVCVCVGVVVVFFPHYLWCIYSNSAIIMVNLCNSIKLLGTTIIHRRDFNLHFCYLIRNFRRI